MLNFLKNQNLSQETINNYNNVIVELKNLFQNNKDHDIAATNAAEQNFIHPEPAVYAQYNLVIRELEDILGIVHHYDT